MFSGRTLFNLSLAIFIAAFSAMSRERLSRREQAYRKLISANLALDQSLFGSRSLREVQRLRRRADEYMLPLIVAIEARYAREMEKDPRKALEVLAPILLGEDNDWADRLHEAEKKRRAKWMEAKRQAYRDRKEAPAEPRGLALAFPPASKAKINELTGECAMEAARSILDSGGDVQMALGYIDALGKDFPTEGRVRAYECLGDVSLRLQMFEKAVGSYKSAKKLLAELKSADGYSEMQKVLKLRLDRKLKEAEQLRDVNRYGVGYVLWREADRLRGKEKAYLEAIELYDRIRDEHPDTVYAVGARCYRVLCLLELAKQEEAGEGELKTFKRVEAKLTDEKRFHSLARRAKVPRATLEEIAADVERIESRLKYLKSIPYGKKALEEAKELAREAIKENMWALWNGEILVAIADFEFEFELNPDEADRYYRQAWAWLQAAEKNDVTVAGTKYAVPAQAAQVTAGPASVVKTDMFGNIKREEIPIGSVINRRTAPWYLDEFRAKTVKAIGFICFYREENEEALAWYGRILAYDQKSRAHVDKREWNDYNRLKWGAENGHLYAHACELELFSGNPRFAVLLADFFFCTERFEKCIAIADALLSGRIGKLGRASRAYPQFVKAAATYWLEGKEAAFAEYEKVFSGGLTSYTADRAKYSAGNCVEGSQSKELWDRGQKHLLDLVKSNRKNIWVSYAKLTYGPRIILLGEYEEGIKILKSVPKDPESDCHGLAQWLISHYEKKHDR